MNVQFRQSFVKDLREVHGKALRRRVREGIRRVEEAGSPQQIRGLKKLRGGDRYYRIRIGDCRLGLAIEGDTVVFVRMLHRRDIYKYFP